MNLRNASFGSGRTEVFCKKRVLKNFAKFTGKKPELESLFNKVVGFQSSSLQLYYKDTPVPVFP